MKTIKREEAIDRIVEDELENWLKKFRENDFSYFEDLIRNGGVLIGFKDMDNEDLEEEYYEKFEEEVQIL
jgi:hypothetical protein